MSGRINLKSVRLKTAQKYSNWLLFYLFFQKQAPFSVPSSQEGTGESKQNLRYEHRRKKADFMRRFKASRERKVEYISQMEKRMRDDYRRRTGKEAESFCVL